jgi:hypothetical protein
MVAQHAVVQTSGSLGRKVQSCSRQKPSSPDRRAQHRPWNATARKTLLLACDRERPAMKKKIYEKPMLVKRGRLTSLTAQIVASGVILGE